MNQIKSTDGEPYEPYKENQLTGLHLIEGLGVKSIPSPHWSLDRVFINYRDVRKVRTTLKEAGVCADFLETTLANGDHPGVYYFTRCGRKTIQDALRVSQALKESCSWWGCHLGATA